MNRRLLLACALAACAAPALAQPPTPADLLGATGDANFLAWLNDFYARALAAGVARPMLDAQLSGLAPDPRVTALDATQSEFSTPVSVYVTRAISDQRVTTGKLKRQQIPQLAAIEQTYGVPREILISVWAMESNFGGGQGDLDVIRCLATLAASGRRRQWAEDQILAALRIIASGDATRRQLRGSWAGAMGQTQFIPSAFIATAVDGDGDGKRDIWGSAPDALASAANLLVKGGWKRGESWAREVVLPPGFDWSLAEGPMQAPSWWQAKGARRADGLSWTAADAASTATIILPSGRTGPAFLIFPNHFAIRTYNNALSYALTVGLLADRLGGGGMLKTPWPKETPLSLTDRMEAQSALARLGFNPGQPDGSIGIGTRQALRAWQKARGLPADGYLSPEMVLRLRDEIAVPRNG